MPHGPRGRKDFTIPKEVSSNGGMCGAQLHSADTVGRLQEKEKECEVTMVRPQNAFGSVPHDLIWKMLKFAGVPSGFPSPCTEIYSGGVRAYATQQRSI